MSLSPICNNSPSYLQDRLVQSLAVTNKLVACKMVSSSVETGNIRAADITSNTITADQIVANSIITTTGGVGGSGSNITFFTDDTNTVAPDSQGNFIVTGGGGNHTTALGVNVMELVDKRNITPFVVGLSPNTAEYTDIQSAITAASAAGGGLVLVTRGSYAGFTLSDPLVAVVGVHSQAVIVTTTTTCTAGTLTNLFFQNGLVVNGAGSYVYLSNCQLEGTTALDVQFTNSSSTLNMKDCEGYAIGSSLNFRNGTFFLSNLTFTQSSLNLFSDLATNQTITFLVKNSVFSSSVINVTNMTNVASVTFSNCDFLNGIEVGKSPSDYVHFSMEGGYTPSCIVRIRAPVDSGTPSPVHESKCVLSYVSFYRGSSPADSSVILYGGICTLSHCTFGVITSGHTVIRHIPAFGANHVLQVRKCIFQAYNNSPNFTCIQRNPNGKVYTGQNTVQSNISPYGGSSTITTTTGGTFYTDTGF